MGKSGMTRGSQPVNFNTTLPCQMCHLLQPLRKSSYDVVMFVFPCYKQVRYNVWKLKLCTVYKEHFQKYVEPKVHTSRCHIDLLCSQTGYVHFQQFDCLEMLDKYLYLLKCIVLRKKRLYLMLLTTIVVLCS